MAEPPEDELSLLLVPGAVQQDGVEVRVEQPPIEIPVRRRSSSGTHSTPTVAVSSRSSCARAPMKESVVDGSRYAASTDAISRFQVGCSRRSARRTQSPSGPQSTLPPYAASSR
jgi:hypothetical protein